MIHLWRTIQVQSFDAEATIALGRDRPELLAVARLAADAHRPITGDDIARELLGSLPAYVGQNVLDRCVTLGLLTPSPDGRSAVITERGALGLEHGKVLLAEEGIFRFHYASDPLLPSPLLHVSRLRSQSARETKDQLKAMKVAGQRPSQGARVPSALAALAPEVVFQSVVNRSLFEVRSAPTLGDTGKESTLRVDLRWGPDAAPTLHLTGELLPPADTVAPLNVDFRHDGDSALGGYSYADLWCQLVGAAERLPPSTLMQWRGATERSVLPLPFQRLAEESRRTFSKSVAIPALRVGSLGDFQPAQIHEVEVVPASATDAQAWCDWLQWDELARGYATPETLVASAASVGARFRDHRVQPRDPADLLRRARQDRTDPRAWHVLAPADLGLWSHA